MSNTIKTKVFGVEVSVEVPSTIEEVAQYWGDRGITGLIEDAVDKVLQHSTTSVWRSDIVEAVEQATGVQMAVVKTIPATKEGGKEIAVYEKDEVFINRAKESAEMSDEDFMDLVRETVAKTPLDASTKSRKTGSNKEYLEMADTVLAAVASGAPTPRGLVGNAIFAHLKTGLEAANHGLVIPVQPDGSITRADLAAAYRTHFEREKAEAANKLGL